MRYLLLIIPLLFVIGCDGCDSEAQEPLQLKVEFSMTHEDGYDPADSLIIHIYRWQGYDTTNISYEHLEAIPDTGDGTYFTQYYLWDYDKNYKLAGYSENRRGQRGDTSYSRLFTKPDDSPGNYRLVK